MSSPSTPTDRGNRIYQADRRHNRRRRIASLFLGAIATLTVAGTASAGEPTRTTEIVHRSTFTTCPGVVLTGEIDLIREITTFYDRTGVAVKRIIHVDATGTITNPVTGETLPTSGLRVFHFDLLTGEAFSTGSNLVTRLPDGGVANPGAGQLVFDAQARLIDHHGPDIVVEYDDLCAALAP